MANELVEVPGSGRAGLDPALAVPTLAHSLRLACVAGLCDAVGERAQPFAEARTLGSLSRSSCVAGMTVPAPGPTVDRGQSMPADVAPEQTNT